MRRYVMALLLLAALLPGTARAETTSLPVIMYHHISADSSKAGDYVVTPEQLEGDLRYLRERGYTVVSLRELVEYSRGTGTLPEKPVLITFDDGQLSVLEYALPLLEKYDMCAVAAVVGKYCDREETLEYRSPEYSYMTWAEVGELAASGRFEIASHTQDMHEESFPRRGCMPKVTETMEQYRAALNADLEAAERKIEAITGERPFCFAYPFGFHCSEAAEVLAGRGYAVALTCEERVNVLSGEPGELMELARFNRSANENRLSFFARLGII